MSYVNDRKLYYQEFLNRENQTRHHKYDEEMLMYDLMKAGDMHAVEESIKMWTSGLPGHLSDDPLRNNKYLFVASITLVTRFAIEGGMDEEIAYNTSDLYIQKMDLCKDLNEVFDVYKDMFSFFTRKMAALKKKAVFSKPVILCMDYIFYHLHEKITVSVLAEHVRLNQNYLSGLFKKETGQNISDYITSRRMQAAKNMLKYSDIDYAEIASVLAFSSQSHFTKVFHQTYGYTPKEYRKRFFRVGFFNSGLDHNNI
jgi:AraC-like DNA-binding protein